MRILGIDPGTGNCGFAVVAIDATGASAVCDLGTFRSDADAQLRARVGELVADVLALVDEWKPDVLVAESPNFPEGKVAAVMTWSAYTTLVAVCAARRIELVVRTPGEWRKLLGFTEEKLPPARKAVRGARQRGLCRCGAAARPNKATCEPCAERARLAVAAKARRKAGTQALMLQRFPGAELLLKNAPKDSHEHAWDALAIATSWTDRATEGRRAA